MKKRARGRIGWTVLAAVLAIIGLGGIRADLAGWWSVLKFLRTTAAQWVLVGAGIALFALFVVAPWMMEAWRRRSRGNRTAAEPTSRLDYFAEHERDGSAWLLRLKSTDPSRIMAFGSCEVTDPEGNTTGAGLRKAEVGDGMLTLRYPLDFDGAPDPLPKGLYEVTWGRHWEASGGEPPRTAARELVARDQFEHWPTPEEEGYEVKCEYKEGVWWLSVRRPSAGTVGVRVTVRHELGSAVRKSYGAADQTLIDRYPDDFGTGAMPMKQPWGTYAVTWELIEAEETRLLERTFNWQPFQPVR